MALRDVLAFTAADDDSIVAQMLDELTETFAASPDGGYNIDDVLFTLAMSVIRLETELIERHVEATDLKADLLNLERRILEAGLPLAARR